MVETPGPRWIQRWIKRRVEFALAEQSRPGALLTDELVIANASGYPLPVRTELTFEESKQAVTELVFKLKKRIK